MKAARIAGSALMGFVIMVAGSGCLGQPGGASAFAGDAGAALDLPVRFSRDFLGGSLIGEIVIHAIDGGAESRLNSPVSYAERAPEGPAPADPRLPDFRDRLGCAAYSDANINVCFIVMPDVSNVEASGSRMQLEGLQNLAPPECQSAAVQGARFVESRKIGDDANLQGVKVTYWVDLPTGPNCALQPTMVDFTLNRA